MLDVSSVLVFLCGVYRNGGQYMAELPPVSRENFDDLTDFQPQRPTPASFPDFAYWIPHWALQSERRQFTEVHREAEEAVPAHEARCRFDSRSS
jgi:hypothetical protein